MPIEIRELQIRVTVNQPGQEGPPAGAAGAAGGGGGDDEKDKMVAQCVEETLRVLREREER
jgi:hypothetical protein